MAQHHSLSTRAIHADHEFLGPSAAVAPDISLTTTFRQVQGLDESSSHPSNPVADIYARETRPVVTRVEKVLESVIGGPTALFPSGIAAAFTILLHRRRSLSPNRLDPPANTEQYSYHGVHQAIRIYRKTRGESNVALIALDDEYPQGNTLAWLETPLNPTGECRSIEHYARRAHEAGGQLCVDSTFGPPPIQDPFKWGADIIMHSASKYFGGHSDALLGTVSVRTPEEWYSLWDLRTYTGSCVGSLETWLLLRSVKTLVLRVPAQCETATKLAAWLASISRVKGSPSAEEGTTGFIEDVWHASLQDGADRFVGAGKQMSIGSACFSFSMTSEKYAEHIGHNLSLFTPAASLGAVESLIEQRILADPKADPRMVRVSIGLESFEDLKADLVAGFAKVKAMKV